MITYGSLVLYQTLIVSTQRGDKHEAMNALEAMNPFLTFRTLATNIKHVVIELPKLEKRFCDSGRAEARAQNVLIVRKIVAGKETIDVRVIAVRYEYVLEKTERKKSTIVYYHGGRIHCLVLYISELPRPPIILSLPADTEVGICHQVQCPLLRL